MADTSLMDIKKVIETEDIDEVNQLLSQNWKLLTTYTYVPYPDTPLNQSLVYSLGLPS